MELEGTEVPILWRGRRVRAFLPTLLADRDLTLSASAAGRSGAAVRSVERGAEALPEDHAPLARLMLRAEGIASSYVEGVTASVVDVLLAEGGDTGRHSPATWVAANLGATAQAVAHASGTAPLDLDELCRWHEALMAGSPTPARDVGRLREQQGWIGGSDPTDAHLVPPPPDRLDELLADLLRYANSSGRDAVTQAAVAHAQFEVVHPFADGNGRIGRVLISWILTRHLGLVTPPPISVRIAADTGGYVAGLTQYRFGGTSEWVSWFSGAVSGAGRAQADLVAAVAAVRRDWDAKLDAHGVVRTLRTDATARQVLALLPRHLVLTAALVARELDVTRQAADNALHTLADAGVVVALSGAVRTGRGRPPRLYVSEELLGLAGASPLRR